MNWYFCSMKLHLTFSILLIIFSRSAVAQNTDSTKSKMAGSSNKTLKFNLNEDGSHYFQATFLNQSWLRYVESNDGTTRFGKAATETFDIGLRRTRIQLFGQVADRAFLYFQFGQNNFNNTAGYNSTGGNRKFAAFFHDALSEFRVSKRDQLKIGAGLTVMNGLSRFSQPSISSIMTLDVPVFLQYSVDQIDQFDRRLAVYARGLIGKLDYRIYASNPFPVNSNGSAAPAISRNANFVNVASATANSNVGINNQYGGYFAYNFFENEPHTTPYMAGTYLGSKKVWNIAVGGVYQKSATWYLSQDETGAYADTSFADMLHLSFETFLDVPVNKEKGTAVNAFAGYYNTNYGKNYLRFNGLMNPATGTKATNLVQANAFGNSFPMFGTGQIVYAQFGFLLPKNILGDSGQLMPYVSAQYADYDALENKAMTVFDIGINWLMNGHRSKLSLDYQNRPTYYLGTGGEIKSGTRKSCVILQYQIFI